MTKNNVSINTNTNTNLNIKLVIVHLLHIFIIGGLFIYVGINNTKIYSFIYPLLIFLGFYVLVYHFYRAYKAIITKKTAWIWVNIFHIIIVAPILLIIGFKGLDTPNFFYELLLMLGFASVGYHGYYLYLELKK